MAITSERARAILDGYDIDALVELIDDPQIEADERPDVALYALQRLEAFFYDKLPKLVIRVCVEGSKAVSDEVRHFFLRRWVREEGFYQRAAMIADLVQRLRAGDRHQLVAAIRTAWSIGYRDPLLEEQLVRIASLGGGAPQVDEAQGYALTVLAWLGYSDCEAILGKLNERWKQNGCLLEPDCWTLLQVSTPDFIAPLRDAASNERVAVSALLKVAERHPQAAGEVWQAFQSLDRRATFGYVGAVAETLDLETVARTLIDEAITAFQAYRTRNVLMPRGVLLRANLPNHLSTYRSVRNELSAHVRDWLKEPAVGLTGNKGRFQTSESLDKEAAWDIVLRLGLPEARTWLPLALEDEANFTLVELGELAGFLQVTEAVGPLAAAVRDEHLDIGVGVGCLRSLGNIGTQDALDALLQSRVRLRRHGEELVPTTLVEAMTSACASIGNYKAVWSTLCDASVEQPLRAACAATIDDLSTYMGASVPSAIEIINLLRTEGPELPGYDWLVLALARRPPTAEVLEFLRELGHSERDTRQLTEALSFTGLLAEFPDRIERLGFERTEVGWRTRVRIDDTAALALLFLYRVEPGFEQAMLEVLAYESFHPTIQVVANLNGSDHLSEAVQDALWQRVLDWNGPNTSDSAALRAVALTRPEVLVQDETVEKVVRWGSNARRAYLAALRTTLEYAFDSQSVARVACQLISDEDAGVRRDAARLARDSDRTILDRCVSDLMENGSELGSAISVVEGGFWSSEKWDQWRRFGELHREPLVREIAERLNREYQQGLLARDYLQVLLSTHDYLDTWCYGQALLHLGNEDTVAGLYAGLPSDVYRRAYLIWLAKQVDKRVDERRRKEAENTELPPPISRESLVQITVEIGQQRLGPFSATLQESQTLRARRWLTSWTLSIVDEPDLIMALDEYGGEDVRIETSDGRSGAVLPSHSQRSSEGSAHLRLLGRGHLTAA